MSWRQLLVAIGGRLRHRGQAVELRGAVAQAQVDPRAAIVQPTTRLQPIADWRIEGIRSGIAGRAALGWTVA
jgi:hypothetical protein